MQVLISGNKSNLEFNSVERCQDVSSAKVSSLETMYENSEDMEILTFEKDGKYIVGGFYVGGHCDVFSIRNFDNKDDAYGYGRALKGYDYFSIKKV